MAQWRRNKGELSLMARHPKNKLNQENAVYSKPVAVVEPQKTVSPIDLVRKAVNILRKENKPATWDLMQLESILEYYMKVNHNE